MTFDGLTTKELAERYAGLVESHAKLLELERKKCELIAKLGLAIRGEILNRLKAVELNGMDPYRWLYERGWEPLSDRTVPGVSAVAFSRRWGRETRATEEQMGAYLSKIRQGVSQNDAWFCLRAVGVDRWLVFGAVAAIFKQLEREATGEQKEERNAL